MKPIIYKSIFVFGVFISILFALQTANAQSSSGYSFQAGSISYPDKSYFGGEVLVAVTHTSPYTVGTLNLGQPDYITRESGDDLSLSFVEMRNTGNAGIYNYYTMKVTIGETYGFQPKQGTYKFDWGTWGALTVTFEQDGLPTGYIYSPSSSVPKGISGPVLTHQGFESGITSRQWQRKSLTATSWTNISGATGETHSSGTLTESTMFRVKINGTDLYSSTSTISVTAEAGSIGPASQTIDVGTSAVSLRYYASYGTTSRQWQKSTDNSVWTNISGATAETYSPGMVSQTTYFRVRVNGLNVYSKTATVTVNPVGGSISPAYQNVDSEASIKTLVHDAAGVTSRQWQHKIGTGTWSNISGATGASYSPPAVSNTGTAPVEHLFRVKVNGLTLYSDEASVTIYPVGSTAVSLTNAQNYTVKYVLREAATLSTLPSDLTTEQAVPSVTYYDGLGRPIQQVEVGGGALMQDIVTQIEYDAMGRADVRQYLPYNAHNGGGRYRTRSTDERVDDYTARFGAEDATRSFVENKYEASPLNRVVESYRPGKDYLPAGKKATLSYGANTGGEVRKLVVSGTTSYTLAVSYYPANSLNKVTATGEDGTVTHTFTDFRGNTVLERIASDGDSQTDIDTYYAYDDQGLLCVVIPPEASSKLNIASVNSIAESNTHIQNYAYIYRYDHRQRMSCRKLPGQTKEEFTYTSRDLMQTRTQGANTWTYTYDVLDRPTEEKLGLTVVARYHYGTTPSLAFNAVTGVVQISDNNTSRRQHMKTYEKITVLDGTAVRSTFVERAFYYDVKGRLIQTVEKNHLGGISRYSTKYDFVGNVLASHESHQSSENATADTKLTTFTYDHRGRPTREVTVMNGVVSSPATVTYSYDELGKLRGKTYGTGTNAVTENITYNIQGWLRNQSSDLFELQLHYYDPRTNDKARWSGDIAELRWEHKGHQAPTSYPANSYEFTYDKLSRLKSYGHSTALSVNPTGYYPWGSANRYTYETLSYDRNGNILSLSRAGYREDNGSYGLDNLTYTYTGNQLTQLAHNNATGSVAQAGTFGYTYDAAGNMTRNARENLDYGYNYLNLLGHVKEGSTEKARYRWLADGTKAGVRNGATGSQGYEYLGSLIYTRNASLVLESASFGGGRINKASSGFEVNYHITDHLGSVRVVFRDKLNVLARNDYYAFGKKHVNPNLPNSGLNRFLYNGKELQTTGNLRFLDYGARMYDSEIARLHSFDPMAEIDSSITPFAYVRNNPVSHIDPTGMMTYHFTGAAAQAAFTELKSYFESSIQGLPDEDERRKQQERTGEQVEATVIETVTVSAKVPKSAWSKFLDGFQTTLDVAGFVPGYGEAADGVNALIYLVRGDNANAALSAAAMIPFAGGVAAGGKLGKKAVKAANKIGQGSVTTLQTGERTLSNRTLKALGLTPDQGRDAIHALKDDVGIPHDGHYKIMSDGSVVHPHTGENYGKLYDYIP